MLSANERVEEKKTRRVINKRMLNIKKMDRRLSIRRNKVFRIGRRYGWEAYRSLWLGQENTKWASGEV